MMKNYSDTDAIVLAAIHCGGNDKGIKSTLDMLDHSILNYGELAQSVNILAAGGLVSIDGSGMHVTEKAKPYLKWRENTGCIAWRFMVSEALRRECYDETAVQDLQMPFTKEEYERKWLFNRILRFLGTNK